MANNASQNTKPPLSNKGGNHPQQITPLESPAIAINLDWLRYTVKYNTTIAEADNLRIAMPRFADFALTGEELANGRGFNRAQRMTIGVIHWHTARPEQGISVELSGRDLGQARVANIADEALLAHISTVSGKVSTMDSAIDVYNHHARPTDIINAQKRGTLRTTAREIGSFTSSQKREGRWYPANTVYIGSPKSERQIKIYDKAAQMKIDGDWVRIEMRWRGPYARAAHRAMLKSGIEEVTRAAVLSMVDLDAKWWRASMSGTLAEIEPISRPETKTLEWLLGAVYNTLERELDGPDRAALLAKYAPLIDRHRRGAGGAS
jgi:phage replication initiation protein